MPLNCYYNGADYWIAESPEAAAAAWTEDFGEPEPDTEWSLCDPAEELAISFDGAPGGGELRTETIARWIAENGPGLLCSENY